MAFPNSPKVLLCRKCRQEAQLLINDVASCSACDYQWTPQTSDYGYTDEERQRRRERASANLRSAPRWQPGRSANPNGYSRKRRLVDEFDKLIRKHGANKAILNKWL